MAWSGVAGASVNDISPNALAVQRTDRLLRQIAIYTQWFSFHAWEKGPRLFTIVILAFLLAAAALAGAIAMAMRNAASRAWRFELARVLGDAFAAIARAPALFALTVLVANGAPWAAAFVAFGTAGLVDLATMATPFATLIAIGLVAMAIGQLGHLLLVAATLDVLEHGRIDVPRAFVRVLPLVPSAVLLLILFWLAIGIGLVFFVVPAIFLACLWFVVTPAMVGERLGAFASLARSADLTAGVRWQLLLLLVIGAVFWLVAQAMIAGIAAIAGDTSVATILYVVLTALLGMIPPAVVASTYHALRTHKEGPRGDDLERVFA